MSEDKYQVAQNRRKRVQTLKKLIILLLFLFILIPIFLCVILFIRVNSLNRTINGISLQLEQLQETMAQQETVENTVISPPVQSNPKTTDTQISENVTTVDGQNAAHKVYLTFDDGPSCYTDDILAILDRYDVQATFFVVGKEDETSKEALKQIVEKGHTLGMHSYSHKYAQIYNSVEDFAADFVKLQDYLYEVTEIKSTIYRFPGGSSNKVSKIPMQEFADYLDTQNITFFDWNVSSGDGGSAVLTPQALTDNCLQGITDRETSIILMHDSAEKQTTVEALPMVIENILAMEDTVILPITEETTPVQHIQKGQ